jgi:glucose/arabinose dehydrogenase
MAGPAPARAQPEGFSLVTVATGLDQPTAFAFKGAKILVTEKASGKVQVVLPDGSLRPQPFVTLNVNSASERGVLGIAVDPQFEMNKFVYIYYTTGPGALGYTGSPKNRVSRFTTGRGSSATARPSSSTTFRPTEGITTGATSSSASTACCTSRSATAGVFHEDAQTLDTLRGKILRIKRDGGSPRATRTSSRPGGGSAASPTGEPPGAGPCKEIYAYGCANRFAFRSGPRTAATSSATSASSRGRS